LWNPDQYARFRGERSQPFFDLAQLIDRRPAMRVADLGCGTGELTRTLHDILQARETVGVDTSEAMLARSEASAALGLSFEQADLREFAARPESIGAFDLVLSNAVLQRLPDQPTILAQLTRMLRPDGQLAVQVGSNQDHPSHTTARELATESPFREALGGFVRTVSSLAPEAYATLLYRLGYQQQHVRLQVYAHRLASRADAVEWARGALLTDYQARLPADLWGTFLERYRERLLPRLDDSRPFVFALNRILVWGCLSGK
jgi:trans-aconitate 2-methyltransferase